MERYHNRGLAIYFLAYGGIPAENDVVSNNVRACT